jgi:transposase
MMLLAGYPPDGEEGNYGSTKDRASTNAHHLGDSRRGVACDANDIGRRLSSQPKGHRRVDLRRVLNGIIFRLRTGCQWNQLPKQFGDDSTVHRHFQRWCELAIFERLWTVLVQACDELGGVDWQWQAADTAMGKARMGGDLVGRNPTDRGKKG